MFEKSLYDLIRGLRNHKGNEREYIQDSLRECRKEIKSQEMDLKATALLKLTYLEMFGHDMSWASFNVLEVMSSPKYLQKRVGYLGAVQSFRPDTEVLMLAENLLKKDLTSPQVPTISLPLIAIPHVISPSMANSLLSDLLPRVTHSYPAVRKKTIATLYRLALVYPETLRPAWPKIKDRLLDDTEDPSVTAAVINVVCELGSRRPQDFLPLAPRLFELLVGSTNNWMAIKIVKLFATLTPLEPRLVKKLLAPLTTIIKETSAMSLLYECIHGIIQGGILETAEGTKEGDEIARLCLGKLRGMLVVEGDPNLKYVALLAFNKIVKSHPYLVSSHEDIIMECIDDADISIRLRALDLVVGMVNAQNLVSIVETLVRQLRNSPFATSADYTQNDRGPHESIIPAADFGEDDAEETVRLGKKASDQPPPLPDDFRVGVIQRILNMCSHNTYANVSDFDWYIEVLVQLVKFVPAVRNMTPEAVLKDSTTPQLKDMAFEIGCEIRNVAVRVKGSRREATQAAELLVSVDRGDQMFPISGNAWQGVLEPTVWVVGEFTSFLSDAHGTMTSLLHSTNSHFSSTTISAYIQAAIKVFACITGDKRQAWTAERKTLSTLLTARMIHFLEPLTCHPSLEVQEQAVEYLELLRLATEAMSVHDISTDDGNLAEAPLLITQVIPALFTGMELNPVARDAQRKVPVPEALDLDKAINDNLASLLYGPDTNYDVDYDNEFSQYYQQRVVSKIVVEPAANRVDFPEAETAYQQSDGVTLTQDILTRRKAERRERYKDDPFYIPSQDNSGNSTPLHNIFKTHNGEDLDIDSIPIMELDLEVGNIEPRSGVTTSSKSFLGKRKPRRNFDILGDETIGENATSLNGNRTVDLQQSKSKKSLLQVDSSGLGSLSLEANSGASQLDIERREAEEQEMAVALKEVERLRLEMQRASERIRPNDVPPEGTLVRRKKKSKKKVGSEDLEPGEHVVEESLVKKKKKKKDKDKEAIKAPDELPEVPKEAVEASIPKKKKKRRQVTFEEDDPPPAEA